MIAITKTASVAVLVTLGLSLAALTAEPPKVETPKVETPKANPEPTKAQVIVGADNIDKIEFENPMVKSIYDQCLAGSEQAKVLLAQLADAGNSEAIKAIELLNT